MKISSKILFALLLPAGWVGAQRAVNVKLPTTPTPPVSAYTLENATDINTQFLDYCAVPYRNGVMFTSARGGKRVFVCDQDLVTGRYSDLYFAKQDAEGRFFSPDMVRGDINGKYHDGAPTFTPDGQTMIFSRNNRDGQNSNGLVDLKIYRAKYDRGNWKDVKELPFNSDEFSNCHPTLSADGNLLFFSSNRPGGYGGMDIYVSKKNGDDWGLPINMGPNVNTVGDEIFPFVTPGNYLYFSSNGKRGLGGLDVFSVLLTGMEASQSLRLPAPINSNYDDFAYTADISERKGYLTSNRPGGKGQDDIYRWNFNGMRPQLATICVVDKTSGERISDANLVVRFADESLAESAEENLVVQNGWSNSCDVKVAVVLGEDFYVEVNKQGYEPVRRLVTATEILASSEYLVPIEMPRSVNFTGMVLNRTNEAPLPGSTVRVLNKCTNEVQEYVADANGSFNFTLDCRCEYEVLAEKSGFAVQEQVFKSGEINCSGGPASISVYLTPTASAPLDMTVPKLETGTIIKLDNLYYDYDKFSIRNDAAQELDRVVELMKKYPSLQIELGSHTDARGSDSYNQRLSQERANAAVQYIVSKGIEKNRLTAKGYGETKLVNGCKNGVECDDATHEQNRRTEIKITRLEEKGVRY